MASKYLFVSAVLSCVFAAALGCDGSNNAMAQPEEPEPNQATNITTVIGKIVDPGDQCNGILAGFDVGDDVTVEIFSRSSEFQAPDGSVENETKGTVAGCSINGSISEASTPYSLVTCTITDSGIPGLVNDATMSILISFSWKDVLNNVPNPKNATVIANSIFDVRETTTIPCAMIRMDSIDGPT